MSMAIMCLETILNYEMTDQEATAFKIACIFVETANKMFPDMKPFKHGSGDPRKRYLFKVCYKMVRENQHRLREKEYPLYVLAQLDIIRVNNVKRKQTPNISPSCLVGDKAWNRWLVWNKLYQAKLQHQAEEADQVGVNMNDDRRVMLILSKDKETLTSRLGGLDRNLIQTAAESRALLRWVATKQVSPYYALLSPVLNNWLTEHKLTLDSMFHIDFNLYRPGVTKAVQEFFDEQYAHESESVG